MPILIDQSGNWENQRQNRCL